MAIANLHGGKLGRLFRASCAGRAVAARWLVRRTRPMRIADRRGVDSTGSHRPKING